MEKMIQYSSLAPESPGQFALVKFLKEKMKESYIKDALPFYLHKRDVMGHALQRYLASAKTVTPKGGILLLRRHAPIPFETAVKRRTVCLQVVEGKGRCCDTRPILR